MKKIKLPESKILRDVRKIKEGIAREAKATPGFYRRLNGLGAELLMPYRSRRAKSVR